MVRFMGGSFRRGEESGEGEVGPEKRGARKRMCGAVSTQCANLPDRWEARVTVAHKPARTGCELCPNMANHCRRGCDNPRLPSPLCPHAERLHAGQRPARPGGDRK